MGSYGLNKLLEESLQLTNDMTGVTKNAPAKVASDSATVDSLIS